MGLRNISKYIMDAAQNIFTLSAANTARTTATNVLPTQPVDAAGNVLGRTAANTARTTGTLVDPVQLVDAAGNVLPCNVIPVNHPQGAVTQAHNAIEGTTTSNEINVGNFNAVICDIVISGSGTWKIDIQGAPASGGTFKDIYDNYDNQLTTGNLTANRMRLFVAIPQYIKVVATEVSGTATCTVNIIPINV